MNKKDFKKIDILMETGWLLIFFLVPLFFTNLLNSTWQISKLSLALFFIEFLTLLWFLKLIFLKEKIFEKNKIKFICPAFIFIFILGLAVLFSDFQQYGFWGYYFRQMGYLAYFHFFLFFLVLFFNLKTKKQVQRIFYAILTSLFLVVFYGILQILGVDPINWSEPAFLTQRIFSTLGQPNFLGSWLLLTLPIFIWLFWHYFSPKKTNQSFPSTTPLFLVPLIICFFFFTLLALGLTQSRGAWIGFILSGLFLLIILMGQKRKKKVFKISFLFLILIFIVLFVFNFTPLLNNENDSVFWTRIKSLTQLKETGRLRIILWQQSLDLIKQKPLLGYGLESQHFIFASYYRPDQAALESINLMPDRAHNDFLDTLLISGILGGLAYLYLIISAFYFGLSNINSQFSEKKLMILVLLTGLWGYLISLQFSFAVITTTLYFWGYLAILLKIVYGIEDK